VPRIAGHLFENSPYTEARDHQSGHLKTGPVTAQTHQVAIDYSTRRRLASDNLFAKFLDNAYTMAG
jgi:hypothetical protein